MQNRRIVSRRVVITGIALISGGITASFVLSLLGLTPIIVLSSVILAAVIGAGKLASP